LKKKIKTGPITNVTSTSKANFGKSSMVRTEPTTTGTAGVDTSLDYINYAGNVTNSTLYLGKS